MTVVPVVSILDTEEKPVDTVQISSDDSHITLRRRPPLSLLLNDTDPSMCDLTTSDPPFPAVSQQAKITPGEKHNPSVLKQHKTDDWWDPLAG